MARLFLSEEEAHNWLPVKKRFDYHTFKQKVIIRVVSGIIILAFTFIIAYFQYASVRVPQKVDEPETQLQKVVCT